MKVLFLDVDEVLSSRRTAYAFKHVPHAGYPNAASELDPIALQLIRRIHEKDVKIVLSSTWRLGRSVSALSKILTLPLFDKTINDGKSFRGGQIKEWLDRHPHVTHYAILDDSSDFLPEQMKYHVKVHYRNGVLSHHYEKICKLLEIDMW